jgi:ATP-dependent Clp protease adaptor protein ClpS
MLHVHTRGIGVAGVYPFEVAETKAHQVVQFARENEMPLQASLRKSEEQG